MNPRVKTVEPLDNYMLRICFDNEEVGYFDVNKYLQYNMFKELKDVSVFNSVEPFLGTIKWSNDADLCPDTVYLESVRK